MKLMHRARGLYQDDRRLLWLSLVFMLLYYGALLSDIGLRPVTEPFDLTFNSMLQHLAHGQFDVDPAIVRNEGFLRDGLVHYYLSVSRP